MSAVIQIGLPLRASPAPRDRQIRSASRAFEALFTLLLIVFAAVAVASVWVVLFYRGNHVALGPHGGLISLQAITDIAPFRTWSLGQKLAYTVVAVVRALPSLYLFWSLRTLFGLYARSEVFSPRNAAAIKAIGSALVADAVAPFVCHVALSATGYEIDHIWMHLTSVQELVLGAMVFVIALVMQAGAEIEEERKGFV